MTAITNLNRNIKRDGDHSVENDDVGEEHKERDDSGACHFLLRHHRIPRQKHLKMQITRMTQIHVTVVDHLEVEANHALPESTSYCTEEAHAEQEDDDAQDDEVQQLVNGGSLEFRLPGILHQFGVFSRKQNDTIAPRSVS